MTYEAGLLRHLRKASVGNSALHFLRNPVGQEADPPPGSHSVNSNSALSVWWSEAGVGFTVHFTGLSQRL
jgi:hypothetical protein